MTRTAFILLLVAVATLLAAAASADVRNVTVRPTLVGAPKHAEANVPFDATLVLRVDPDMTLGAVSFSGRGWAVEAGPRTEAPGEPNKFGRVPTIVRIPITASATAPDWPLTVRWEVAGEEGSRTYDLSRRAWEEHRPQMALVIPDGGTLADARQPDTWFRHPSFDRADGMDIDALREANEADKAGKADSDPGTPDVTFTVTGSVETLHIDAQGHNESVPMRQSMVLVSAWTDGWTMMLPAAGTTDDAGDFSITFAVGWPYPSVNVQVTAYASNAHAQVQDIEWATTNTYRMLSDVLVCPAGGSVSVGRMVPAYPKVRKAFYIAETMGRCWEYWNTVRGIAVDHVEVEWPVYDGSYADFEDDFIAIDAGRGYYEATIAHEYGHHLHNQVAFMWDPADVSGGFYCNPGGYCDGGDCGHCGWLPESGKVAWIEGLAEFFANLALEYVDATFAAPGEIDTREIETIQTESAHPDPDPTITEGYAAAVLWDLHDTGLEDDKKFPFKLDRVDGRTDEIFNVLGSVCGEYGLRPRYITWFLDCFKNTYPEIAEEFWETCRNNGFEVDEGPPSLPNYLSSVPDVNVRSTKSEIVVRWERPDDDASGVAGYGISWTQDAPEMPTLATTIGDVTKLVGGPFWPGAWYLNIRPFDAASNINRGYVAFGPFYLDELTDADLAPWALTGWDYEVVPRNDRDAVGSSVDVTASLPGNTAGTYWNIAGRNVGTQMSPQTNVALTVDGVAVDSVSFAGLPPGNGNSALNRGPVTVRGGRHMFGMVLDAEGAFLEPDETDNYRAGQWAWSPDIIDPNLIVARPAPAPIEAGLFGFGWEQPYHYNCDGFRAPYVPFHQAVWMYTLEPGVDYDLQLFNGASTPEAGFVTPQAFADRPADCLEALIWNPAVEGYLDHNVGVYNVDPHQPQGVQYQMRRVESTYLGATHGTVSGELRGSGMLDLYTFYADSPTDGVVDFTIEHDHDGQVVYIGTFGETFARGSLLDATRIEEVPAGTPVSIQMMLPINEMGLVAVWQEPVGEFIQRTTYTLTFESGRPNLAADAPEFWVEPLVPRADLLPNYPFTIVNDSATLDGDGGPAYLFMATHNDSYREAPTHDRIVYLDGDTLSTYTGPAIAAGEFHKTRDNTPFYIPGGRHTLGMRLDAAEAVAERSELDNAFANQWVWMPPELAWGTSRSFSTPPRPDGGWEALPDTLGPEDLHYYNCLGFRKPAPSNGARFAAVYAGGAVSTNLEVRLHEPATGSRTGFQRALAQSTVGGNVGEFVVIDRDSVPAQVLDVGVLRTDGDSGGRVQCEEARPTMLVGPGTYGPFTMARADYLDVHELRLETGIWTIEIVPDVANTARLAIGHIGTADGFGSLEASGGTTAMTFDSTRRADFAVNIDALTDAPLCVWRPYPGEGGTSATYGIVVVAAGPVGVQESLVPAGKPLAVAPNPFNASTRIAFRLLEPGFARLTIYDMRGAAIRKLREASLDAGVHRVSWDGRNDAGAQVASGTYFVRFVAGDHHDSQRLVLIK